MEIKGEKSILSDIPSLAQAILWVIASTLVLFGLGEGVGNILKIDKEIAGPIPYIIFDVLIALGCFYIIKWNPKSVWYVPLICNAIGIIAAIIEPTFWKTPLWMLFCGGWVLSLVTSILGVRVGKRAGTNPEKASL